MNVNVNPRILVIGLSTIPFVKSRTRNGRQDARMDVYARKARKRGETSKL